MIELRRDELPTYEISARLADDGTGLNRTSVAATPSEEGFGRLLRHPTAQAHRGGHPGRDTRPRKTTALNFATWSARVDSAKAGLLLIPDLVAFDLPAVVRTAGYPGTRIVPTTSWPRSSRATSAGPARRRVGVKYRTLQRSHRAVVGTAGGQVNPRGRPAQPQLVGASGHVVGNVQVDGGVWRGIWVPAAVEHGVQEAQVHPLGPPAGKTPHSAGWRPDTGSSPVTQPPTRRTSPADA